MQSSWEMSGTVYVAHVKDAKASRCSDVAVMVESGEVVYCVQIATSASESSSLSSFSHYSRQIM